VAGVRTATGDIITADAVVLTTGTFLRGVVHLGLENYPAGRHKRDSDEVEAPSIGLAETLERLRFPLSRLSTGTPPRLDARTIDYEGLEVQPSELPPPPFSYLNDECGVEQVDNLVDCHLTHTNSRTHHIVAANSDKLPTFLGNQGKV